MSKRIVTVMLFKNGLCAVFDEQGRQMSALQGEWRLVRKRVLARADAQTRFEDYRDRVPDKVPA